MARIALLYAAMNRIALMHALAVLAVSEAEVMPEVQVIVRREPDLVPPRLTHHEARELRSKSRHQRRLARGWR